MSSRRRSGRIAASITTILTVVSVVRVVLDFPKRGPYAWPVLLLDMMAIAVLLVCWVLAMFASLQRRGGAVTLTIAAVLSLPACAIAFLGWLDW